MNDVVPDLVEECVGWRAWAVVEGPRLASMPGTPVWEPGEVQEAECGRGHTPPGVNCSCGIYAAISRERLGEMRYGDYDLWAKRVVVVGEISLWGGVVPAEWGYRAQFAYPRKLMVPYECWELVTPLRDDYRVPVKLANTFRLKERLMDIGKEKKKKIVVEPPKDPVPKREPRPERKPTPRPAPKPEKVPA